MVFVDVTIAILITMTAVGFLATFAGLYNWIPQDQIYPRKSRYAQEFEGRIKLISFNLALMIGGAAFVLPMLADAFDYSSPWTTIALQFAIVCLVDDTIFHFWHRILHENRWLYRKVHSIHHRAYAPVPMDYIYAHPVEWIVGTLGPIVGFIVVSYIFGSISVWTLWIFAFWRQFHELMIHSNTPSKVATNLPLLSSTENHGHHHAKPSKGNYSSTLVIWDFVFRTRYQDFMRRAASK